MAITDKTTLKNWFRNKLKPSQEQFWVWIDSFWHKSEPIPTSSIDGLDDLLADAATVPQLEALENLFQDSLESKVDKVTGKQLSTEDFTTLLKTKLEIIDLTTKLDTGEYEGTAEDLYAEIPSPDNEDLYASSGNVLKFNNYTSIGNEKSRIIVRSSATFLDLQNQFTDKTNTIFEIRYEHDFDGNTLNLPSAATLYFNGGKFKNGSISSDRDYNYFGDYTTGLKDLTDIFYAFDDSKDADFCIDVTDMPGVLAKYNLISDGVTDNSDNFIAIFSDSWFLRVSQRKRITLLFPASNRTATRPVFLFKKPVEITFNYHLRIHSYCDFKFDFSEYAYSFRTKQQISDGVEQFDMTAFKFINCSSFEFEGFGINKSEGTKSGRIMFDGGASTIQGDFFEGVIINSTKYFQTEKNAAMRALFCKNAKVKGVHFTNALDGILVDGNHVEIDNCEASSILSSNGISVGNAQNSSLAPYNRFAIIKNCYVHDCQDLGISIQCINAIVENCIAENCGNNNIANLATFGINNSFNAGGGYSIELLAVENNSDRENVNVLFLNCVARDCYNYGFSSDSGGVKFNSCTVRNITPTYRTDSDIDSDPDLPSGLTSSSFLFTARKLRAGSAFQLVTTNYLVGEVREFLRAENCHIDGVPFIFINNLNNYFPAVRGIMISNSVFKNINGNSEYSIGYNKNAFLSNCELPTSYVAETGNTYRNCFKYDGTDFSI